MWRRPVVTILMLIIAVILALPLRAQPNSVAQGPLFGLAALPSTCATTALPAGRQQEPVAPGVSPAHADVAASLPRHGGVKPPLRHASLKVSAAAPGTGPAKPFTQEQVVSMVRDGFGDESGAKLIDQWGIDFAPSEDFYQTLKAAGASEAFLKALRAAKPPEPASAKKPLNQVQVFALLVGQVPSHRVTMLVQERGIDFEPTDDYLQEVRLAGGEDELISALKSAKVTKRESVDPALQARQTEVRQHVARGAEFFHAKRYAHAGAQSRAAVRLDPQNAELHVDLGAALAGKGDQDGAMGENREALSLNPNNDIAHNNLGFVLGGKGDFEGMATEERAALRLNPDYDMAHANLGLALGGKGDTDGMIAEEREALRLNPNNAQAHTALGIALDHKGDLDGTIAEYREALRLNPNDGDAHSNLGMALGKKGDRDVEIAEEREALRLNPNDADAHYNLGNALMGNRDLDGAITEYREVLRLDPDRDMAHANLGSVLGGKGDRDGMIAEERAALRLNPNNDMAHYGLGLALEQKGDRRGALEEYRAAYTRDPRNPTYKQNYQRLLRKVGH